MINMSSNTKEQYKQYERQLSVYGNLYLAKSRESKNIFNYYAEVIYLQSVIMNRSTNNILLTTRELSNWTYAAISLDADKLLGKTIYFQADYNSTSLRPGMFIAGLKNRYIVNTSGTRDTLSSGKLTFSYTFPSSLPSDIDEYCLLLYANAMQRDNAQIGDYTLYTNIMISEDENAEYEEWGTMINEYTVFPLTEENECKILGFNINEKADIYYTSLPYNTMTIEVDNEKGYFTDYDPDNIISNLNSDCYIDLFIKINNDDYYKINTMKFDKISSSDYEKAKLSFKSSLSLIPDLALKDKDEFFIQYPLWSMSTLLAYIENNYDIKCYSDVRTNSVVNTINQNSKSVQNLILQAGTKYGNLSNATFVINNSEDKIVFRTWKNYAQDTILLDYQLEKPVVKRENTYNGVLYNYLLDSSYTSTSETFSKIINGYLTEKREVLIIRDNDYILNTITINDITISGDIDLEVETTNNNENIVALIINGEIGTEYTIEINKSNISKKANDNFGQKSYGIINKTSKIIRIETTSALNGDYYNLILNEKKIKSYIEAKIIGLPYIEIGDTVEIETENAKILMTITETDKNYDGGCTMTIKGYELGWDALFPSDTLYPSDNLLPNKPVN